MWLIKKHNFIEINTFGSVFTYLRVGIGMNVDLRYKPRMAGVNLEVYVHIKVDNMSMVNNTPTPEIIFRNNSNSTNDNL